MAEIEVRGIREAVEALGRPVALDVLEPAMWRVVLRVQNRMADYPPAPASSQYVRTGTLGRRWTTEVNRSLEGLQGRVGNNTVYGPFVQSSQFQARMHQGRWQTDEQVLQQEEGWIVEQFERAIEDAVR